MPFDFNAYNREYKREKYDRIQVLLPKGTKELLTEAAQEAGLSLNKWATAILLKAAEKTE